MKYVRSGVRTTTTTKKKNIKKIEAIYPPTDIKAEACIYTWVKLWNPKFSAIVSFSRCNFFFFESAYILNHALGVQNGIRETNKKNPLHTDKYQQRCWTNATKYSNRKRLTGQKINLQRDPSYYQPRKQTALATGELKHTSLKQIQKDSTIHLLLRHSFGFQVHS